MKIMYTHFLHTNNSHFILISTDLRTGYRLIDILNIVPNGLWFFRFFKRYRCI